MKLINFHYLSVAALAFVALGAANSAQARDIHWSLGVHAAPGVTFGVGNASPMYVAPAPVYVAPPVYLAPAPVYYGPRYYAPAYYGPVVHHRIHHHRPHHRHHSRGHGRHGRR